MKRKLLAAGVAATMIMGLAAAVPAATTQGYQSIVPIMAEIDPIMADLDEYGFFAPLP